jgi:RTX calcium-binding nonapeptide repeat (4 copies)
VPLPRSVRAAGLAGALAAGALVLPSAASAAYTSSIDGGNPTLTGDANGDQLVISVQGANLAHNRATDPGFDSAIDFDSGTAGEQTVANTASVTVNAGDGDDFVQTSPNADTLNGEGGNDRLIGGVGNDTFRGGAGNDQMVWNNGDNNDVMDGEGGGGDETEVNGAVAAGDAFTIVSNGARTRFDRTNLVPFNLDVGETTERLTVNGNGGNDTMGAGAGLNGKILLTLTGGPGTDGIQGGDGSDLITGGDGNDTLNGGDGDDRIVGDRGDDTMAGQNGDDTMVWNNGDNNDKMDGEGGLDRTEVNGAVAQGDAFVTAPNGERVKFDRTNLVPFTLDIGSTETLELNTFGGDDTIAASPGSASLIGIAADGGSGNDRIDVRDNAPTLVRCGDGNDGGTADGIDTVGSDCEAIERTVVGPAVAIGAGRVKAGGTFRKATAPIRLTCPALAATGCSGKLTLTSASSLRLGRTKVIAVLGSANYRLTPGQARTVRVKLPSTLKTIAGRRKSLSIRATTVGRDGSGVVSEASRRLTVTLPKR